MQLRFNGPLRQGARMKCNNLFQCDTKQFEFAALYRAKDPMVCRLSGSTETLCPLELPQLHCC